MQTLVQKFQYPLRICKYAKHTCACSKGEWSRNRRLTEDCCTASVAENQGVQVHGQTLSQVNWWRMMEKDNWCPSLACTPTKCVHIHAHMLTHTCTTQRFTITFKTLTYMWIHLGFRVPWVSIYLSNYFQK